MSAEYLSYKERKITGQELIELYRNAGWWEERMENDIENMLESTDAVGAWRDGVLIGFARAVSDGRFRAYVEDVVVHTKYQKSGIGEELVTRLLQELSEIDIVSLFCEEGLVSFYEKNQFKYSKSQKVMHRKRSF